LDHRRVPSGGRPHQHRFTKITDREVEFLTEDLKEKRGVTTHYLIEEFVDALAAHVPDRYRHAMRRFGLLAPALNGLTPAIDERIYAEILVQ